MASTIMHMAVTKQLAEKLPVKDTDRLMLGAVMPDAYAEGFPKDISHLDILLCGCSKKTYDLTAFRKRFAEKLNTDSLYLGYYLHLVQDLTYRSFVYNEHHWNPGIPGNVKRLHNDYALLNTYLIGKYGLQNTIKVPENFSSEPINSLYPFELKRFLEYLDYQFIPYNEGEIFFFTEEMADSFIEKALDICVEEVRALSAGKRFVDEYEWAWVTRR